MEDSDDTIVGCADSDTSRRYCLFTSIWILHGVGGYGISLVLPQVIKDLGKQAKSIK